MVEVKLILRTAKDALSSIAFPYGEFDGCWNDPSRLNMVPRYEILVAFNCNQSKLEYVATSIVLYEGIY